MYVRDAAGLLRFHALSNPRPKQVADVARWTHEQLIRVWLERLCRYVTRPPVSQERLELAPDRQRLVYRFKRAWRDGTHAVLLDPLDFIGRLVALIPPPRFHLLRYHGVLAAHANARSEVVPGRPAPEPPGPARAEVCCLIDATTKARDGVAVSRHLCSGPKFGAKSPLPVEPTQLKLLFDL